jgi:hypothetical protein
MREKIKLVSSANTGHFYTTDKNKRTMHINCFFVQALQLDPKTLRLEAQ